MKEELVILEEDKAFARMRIAELEKAIQDLGPEFYEVFNQSSETWHDNAPFDALRDRQSVLDAELQKLRSVLRDSAISVPKVKRGMVGVGSRVAAGGKTYLVAGDWTPHAGQLKDGVLVLSCKAPLAQELIGKRAGDEVKIGRKLAVIETVE